MFNGLESFKISSLVSLLYFKKYSKDSRQTYVHTRQQMEHDRQKFFIKQNCQKKQLKLCVTYVACLLDTNTELTKCRFPTL